MLFFNAYLFIDFLVVVVFFFGLTASPSISSKTSTRWRVCHLIYKYSEIKCIFQIWLWLVQKPSKKSLWLFSRTTRNRNPLVEPVFSQYLLVNASINTSTTHIHTSIFKPSCLTSILWFSLCPPPRTAFYPRGFFLYVFFLLYWRQPSWPLYYCFISSINLTTANIVFILYVWI